MNRKLGPVVACTVLLLAALACSTPSFTSRHPTQAAPIDAFYTQAAQTLIAQLTEQASATPGPGTTGGTPLQPSATLLPSSTPLPTNTPLPTITPIPPRPTSIPTSTPVPMPCNAAKFVKDITIPDGSRISAGTLFTKTWLIANVGSCAWETGYALVFSKGDLMNGLQASLLPEPVQPGDTIELSVELTAPWEAGDYKGYWMLQDAHGDQFGVGSRFNDAFWVDIEVRELKQGELFDFASSYCAATWTSGAGKLPCPGRESSDQGFVIRLENPDLENRREDEPALWTNPQDVDAGWIMGVFPAVKIKSGDLFLADVGCLDGYKKCNVTFKVGYRIGDGAVKQLGQWKEEFDGEITHVDLDLSSLAGETVHFVLIVETNGSPNQDAAFWLVPHIERP